MRVLRPFADHAAVPLSNSSHNVRDQLPRWSGGVDPEIERDQRLALITRRSRRLGEVQERPRQSLQLGDDQRLGLTLRPVEIPTRMTVPSRLRIASRLPRTC